MRYWMVWVWVALAGWAVGERRTARTASTTAPTAATRPDGSEPAMILAGLHEAQPMGERFVARNGFEALDEKWWTGLKRKLHLPNLPYMIHLPAGYAEHPGERFPMILFLHGSGEAGNGDEQ